MLCSPVPANVSVPLTVPSVRLSGTSASTRLRKVGAPLLSGATVQATVLAHGRHDKVTIFKMRRRKHYQRHQGHRQNYTEIRIEQISAAQ